MSSLVARCPHCDTAFRVVPEQLRVRQGKVRCGVCNEIFDGNAALVQAGLKPVTLRFNDPVAAAPVVTPAGPGSSGPFAASSSPWSAASARSPLSPSPATPARSAVASASTSSSASASSSATSAAPPVFTTPATGLIRQAAAERRGLSDRQKSSSLEPVEPSLGSVDEGPLRADRRPRLGQNSPLRAEPRLDDSRLTERRWEDRTDEDDLHPAFSAAEETDDFDWPGPAAFAASRPGVAPPPLLSAPPPVFSLGRVLFMLGFWLALLALIIQALWWWRTPLATHIPALRAPFESVCQALGCEVGYVRAPQRLSIVSSAVQPAVLGGSADVQHLQLQAVLRNRAPHDQPWPHLEVILTDHSDGTVARRVVAPDVYLPDGLWRQPFPAASDQPINLALAARGNPVSGYRLALFFP